MPQLILRPRAVSAVVPVGAGVGRGRLGSRQCGLTKHGALGGGGLVVLEPAAAQSDAGRRILVGRLNWSPVATVDCAEKC